jgi:hypothetical protein
MGDQNGISSLPFSRFTAAPALPFLASHSLRSSPNIQRSIVLKAMIRIFLPRLFTKHGKACGADQIVGVDADLFAGDDGLADRGQKLVDLPARFRGKHEMIVNLRPDAAVWKHDLCYHLNHLVAVL